LSRDQIISELYNCHQIDDCISKKITRTNQADFKQELFVFIAEMNERQLLSLYEQGRIKFYIVRMILNMACNRFTRFHKTYLDKRIVYDTDKVYDLISDQQDYNEREGKIISEIDKLDNQFGTPALRMMAILVSRHGSQREVSRLTGVPCSVISRGLKKVREHLQTI